MRPILVTVLLAFAAGCAGPETKPTEIAQAAHAPAPPVRRQEPLACPPAPKPQCPAPQPAPPEYRGKLERADWSELPGWGRESLRPSFDAFVRSCTVLGEREAWRPACDAALALPASAADADLSQYFRGWFDPYRVLNADDTTTGMVTGYYEPLLHGSRTRTRRYRYPIYAPPPDLLTIDLSSVYPELKHRRLRGRLEGNRVVPYYSRGDIDSDPQLLKGMEIAWVDDEIDDFFLHIQGSGQIELPNGQRIRVGYADQNGQPFRSLGALLIRDGEIPAERASMQGIKEWAKRHKRKIRQYLDANPSYVFFRELPSTLPGPIGALGVPLTPERSIAIDPRVIPLGAPVYLATTWPESDEPLERLMVAQDTGGAINGAVRADFFWGFGDSAGALAGKMRQDGRMWVLLPKGYSLPEALVAGGS
ncbi:MAG TPA: MltA domain-containing protein [Usitatibacter sp.]|nr:MltA domain-containing protein [Usitatibacter sp.]